MLFNCPSAATVVLRRNEVYLNLEVYYFTFPFQISQNDNVLPRENSCFIHSNIWVHVNGVILAPNFRVNKQKQESSRDPIYGRDISVSI